MELAPSFKMNKIKEWSDGDGHYDNYTNCVIRGFNRGGWDKKMERSWI